MKKYFYLQPRQSGKTTIALYEYLKNPDETLFVVHNTNAVRYICDIINGDLNNFVSSKEILKRLRGRKIKRIILDEYLFFDNIKELYLELSVLDIEELLIFSSYKVLYPNFLFEFVKRNKNSSYHDVCSLFTKTHKHSINEQISDLYFNFITDQDMNLIETRLYHKPNSY